MGKRTYYAAASPDKLIAMTQARLQFIKKIYRQLEKIKKNKSVPA